jgi:hypothetical protein
MPWSVIVAAWEVKLLFSWLYVSPKKYGVSSAAKALVKRDDRTVDGVPQENAARLQATLDLINPLVVVLHPCGALALDFARLRVLPESWGGEVLVHPVRVQTPFTLGSEGEETERGAQDGASWWCVSVPVAANPEDEGAHKEHSGGKRVREPEADELIR